MDNTGSKTEQKIPEKTKQEIIECFHDTTETRCFKCHKFRLAEKKWGLQLTYELCREISEKKYDY